MNQMMNKIKRFNENVKHGGLDEKDISNIFTDITDEGYKLDIRFRYIDKPESMSKVQFGNQKSSEYPVGNLTLPAYRIELTREIPENVYSKESMRLSLIIPQYLSEAIDRIDDLYYVEIKKISFESSKGMYNNGGIFLYIVSKGKSAKLESKEYYKFIELMKLIIDGNTNRGEKGILSKYAKYDEIGHESWVFADFSVVNGDIIIQQPTSANGGPLEVRKAEWDAKSIVNEIVSKIKSKKSYSKIKFDFKINPDQSILIEYKGK